MSWSLHHANIPAQDVAGTAEFYENILGAKAVEPDFNSSYTQVTTLAWIPAENGQSLHITRPNPNFARDKGWHLNPVINGHLALTVDDIDRVRAWLEEQGYYVAAPGEWALKGFRQLYTVDPAGHCLEINQKVDG